MRMYINKHANTYLRPWSRVNTGSSLTPNGMGDDVENRRCKHVFR